MGSSMLVLVVLVSATGAPITPAERQRQETVFSQSVDDKFVWRLDELPDKSGLASARVPYSGHIYLDKDGGTSSVLRKYDRAFNGRSFPASSWEKNDAALAKEPLDGPLGFLGISKTHDWYGHCNGWTAASIKHAEPEHSVQINGVVFSPADIKGLLAEIYVYNDHEVLAGLNEPLNAGSFHAILANWLGRSSHPIGMDLDPGEEKWNYPLYAYSSSFGRHSATRVEVKSNILYATDTEDREYDESPRYHDVMHFHYMLQLNQSGEIVGGYFFKDSDKLDFLWVPKNLSQPGTSGNAAGNPHLNADRVLSLWRASVRDETRRTWAEEEDSRYTSATPPEPAPLYFEPGSEEARQEGPSVDLADSEPQLRNVEASGDPLAAGDDLRLDEYVQVPPRQSIQVDRRRPTLRVSKNTYFDRANLEAVH